MSTMDTVKGTIEGQDITIVGETSFVDQEMGTREVCLTVTVEASGKSFKVGGAFITAKGTYETYDIGDLYEGSGTVSLKGLTSALGYDEDDLDTLESVLSDLYSEAEALFEAAVNGSIADSAPECSHEDGHHWKKDPDDGNRENPGVWSLGGTAIMVRQYCLHCGCKRERVDGGGSRDGVTYEENALTEEELAKLRAAYKNDD